MSDSMNNVDTKQESEEWSRDSDNQILSNLAQTNLNSASSVVKEENDGTNATSPDDASTTPYRQKSSKNEEKKLFVGGISWDTSDEDLKIFFTQFGEVTHVQIKFDHFTGRSRGFAFVEFATGEACQKALNSKAYDLKGKKIEIKPAKSRENKKIFVGGLPGDFTEEELRQHFDQYGKIEEIEWPFDKFQNKRKNFAFIVFEDEDATQRAAVQAKQKFGDRMCDVKIAVPQYMRPQRQFGAMPMAPAAYGTGWNDFTGYGAYGAAGPTPGYPGYPAAGGYGAGAAGMGGAPGAAAAAGGGYYDDYYAAAAAAGHHGAAAGYGAAPNDYGAAQHAGAPAAAAGSYDYTGWQTGAAAAGGYDGWNYGGMNPGAGAAVQGQPGRPVRGGYGGYGGY